MPAAGGWISLGCVRNTPTRTAAVVIMAAYNRGVPCAGWFSPAMMNAKPGAHSAMMSRPPLLPLSGTPSRNRQINIQMPANSTQIPADSRSRLAGKESAGQVGRRIV